MDDLVQLQIAAMPVRDRIPADKPLAERIAFAMRYVLEHEDLFWISYRVDDDLKLRTALAAVMLAGNKEDRMAIKKALEPLKMLSAVAQGIPVNFDAFKDYADVLPLMQMWLDSKEKTKTSRLANLDANATLRRSEENGSD
jgi:hypothetical protein